MKHIETKSNGENEARVKYAEAKEGTVVASDALAEKVAELLALRHKMDEDELRKSQLMGDIMEEMKTATVLKNKEGDVIVNWKVASMKSTVDYKGLLKKYKVTAEDLAAFTKKKMGARTFELIETPEERAEVVSLIDQMKI